jgi:hypothetical protein
MGCAGDSHGSSVMMQFLAFFLSVAGWHQIDVKEKWEH